MSSVTLKRSDAEYGRAAAAVRCDSVAADLVPVARDQDVAARRAPRVFEIADAARQVAGVDVAQARCVSDCRRLLEHCGLAWDDACLAFHENKAAVATPSAAQVRRPINADSVGKWRAHEDALVPALSWLKTQGIEVD